MSEQLQPGAPNPRQRVERRRPRPIPAPYIESDAELLRRHQEREARLIFAMLMLRIITSPAYRAAGGSISTP